MKKTIAYEFEALNPIDYRIEIKQPIESRMLNFLFQQSRIALRKRGIILNKTPEDINEFDLPDKFLNLLRTLISKTLKDIERQVKRDNIELITLVITRSYFIKQNNDWLNTIVVNGTYADKR